MEALVANAAWDDKPVSRLVRTYLSPERLAVYEEIEALYAARGLDPMHLCQVGAAHAARERPLHDNPRSYLQQQLRSLGFGEILAEGLPADRKEREKLLEETRIQKEFLRTATTAELALQHYVLAQRRRNVQPGTVETYRYVLAKFLSIESIREPAEITKEKLERFIFRPGVSSATKRDQQSRLHGFCEHLRVNRLLATNPTALIKRAKKEVKPIVFLDIAAVRRALEFYARATSARSDVPRYGYLSRFLLNAFTGIRPDEIARLKPDWSDFNFETGTVQIARTKRNDENVTLTLVPALVPLLRIFRDRGLKPYADGKLWDAGRRHAGFPKVNDLLRHTFGSYRYAVRPSFGDLEQEMNNSVAVLRAHYVNTSVTKSQGEAYFALLDEVENMMALTPADSRASTL